MIRVAVVGATGYAGAELVRLLAGHPGVKIAALTSRQYAGTRFDAVYPALAGVIDLELETMDPDEIGQRADVVFTALPHKIPMGIVPGLLEHGLKVVDLSADFRLRDQAVYEAHYVTHTSAHLLDQAVYGLCEIYADQIRGAVLVGNPGCYPTSALLPLVPLLKAGLIDTDGIIIDSKSGVSGAGRSVSQTVHFCHVNESLKAYKIASHRHMPEIEEVLSLQAGQPVEVMFSPHLIPMTRGMLTTTYGRLKPGVTGSDLAECLRQAYDGKPFLRLCSDDRLPDTLNVRGTNYCDIGFRVDDRVNRVVLVSAIDNLVKGAAGQAVQNMNIMFGLEETAGLDTVPFPL
ncbi:MAG: N-acetyl-gamma-glutamyl-phosphate reductase [Deltaproteobacteria bacterium]|nr:MAG: N-acetyl-gamma-glutamyl-phosphate reductase [Deltaproteobacteria bacterium]